MSLIAHPSFPACAAIAAPAALHFAHAGIAAPRQMLAIGERKVAQQILAQVSLQCRQEAEARDEAPRSGRGFWSFLRANIA